LVALLTALLSTSWYEYLTFIDYYTMPKSLVQQPRHLIILAPNN
jgi:hypothetical protein